MKLLLFLFIFICASSFAEETPKICKNCNLIIISLTSARNRNMSTYGYFRKTTPNIDKFFQNAYVFNNAFATASLTFTDALSFFYSLFPMVHNGHGRGNKALTSSIIRSYNSLSSLLVKAGYKTAAFVSDEDYEYGWGIGKTFQLYFDRSYYSDYGIRYSPFTFRIGTKDLIPVALEWLKNSTREKKFLYLQAYDVHCPYSPEGEFNNIFQMPHSKDIPFETDCFMNREPLKKEMVRGRNKYVLKSFFTYLNKYEIKYYFDEQDLKYLVSRYDAELAQADHNLEKLFAEIVKQGLEKNSIIIFTSDHGDYLGENGFFMKASPLALGNIHNANLNFPLLIKFPGQNKKFIQKQLVQTVDLAPSILEMLGLRPDTKMQGKSFKNILGTDIEINDYAYSFSIRHDVPIHDEKTENSYALEVLQDHTWKMVRSKKLLIPLTRSLEQTYFLYNLKKDPNEKRNLYKVNSPLAAALLKTMDDKYLTYSKK